MSTGNTRLAKKNQSGELKEMSLETVLYSCVGQGLLTDKQARFVSERQKIQRAKLASRASIFETPDPIDELISFELVPPSRGEGSLDHDEVLDALSQTLNVERVHIDPLKLDAEAIVKALPKPFARRHSVLVLDPSADRVPVAAANPLDMAGLDTVRQRLGKPLRVYLAGASEIRRLIREIYGFKSSVAAAERDLDQLPDIQNLEQFFQMRQDGEVDVTDSHIVRAVDHLLRYAFDQRASDIHIEPKRDRAVVRLRIDGVLHSVHRFSRAVQSAIVSRLKTLARMDIAEKRLPQDGRIRTSYGERMIELRVSSLPVAFGEKLVMRVFDPNVLTLDLPDLGIINGDLELVESFLERRSGIFLVTGPTGSGKTTTLYSALRRLATEVSNVSTVEDPIENVSEDFNQVGVQPQVGLTFASALRTLLRQDPDIIMVGEIRDGETAKMAIQAALTGHLVLSTLHTNNAPGGITRLLDMGVEPYLLSSTLLGIMAQRLVRTICTDCATRTDADFGEATALGLDPSLKVTVGEGCPKCRNTGYRGRTGIYEIMPVTPKITEAINSRHPTEKLWELGRSEGMRTLAEAGAEKVTGGLTTPAEVLVHLADG